MNLDKTLNTGEFHRYDDGAPTKRLYFVLVDCSGCPDLFRVLMTADEAATVSNRSGIYGVFTKEEVLSAEIVLLSELIGEDI